MTNDKLQQELKEKVKAGVKPSDLKKLKRSKSADDIPAAPPLPKAVPLSKSQSNPPFNDPKYPYTTLITQAEKITELEKETKAKSDTISLLRKKIESLEKDPPNSLLQDQLKEKQKQIEELREELEEKDTNLTQTLTELDNSLFSRHEAIKQFGLIYDKLQVVKLELLQETDIATDEIISQDKEISQLRSQKQQAKLKMQELEKDLKLAQRLAELRKIPFPENENN